MGLDTVELVLSFEATFQISIPDHEAEKMRTPRDVIDFMASQLGVEADGPARIVPLAEESVLTRVTGALRTLGIAREPLRMELALDEIFANTSLRHQQWRQLQIELIALDWPSFPWLGFSTHFPKGLETLGDLVHWLVRCHALPLSSEELRQLTRADIALLVKHITLRQLGVSEKSYGEDKDYIVDFGAD